MNVSLCMIVKNEEKVLGRCLSSVASLVDEIVIADTGSTDKTKEIAKSFTDRVYDFAWIDDFSAARNYSFSLATGDYIMWLDADDIVQPQEAEKWSVLKNTLKRESPNAVFCPYLCPVNAYTPPLSYFRERILKRSSNPVWQGAVHECIQTKGKIAYSDFSVLHGGSEKKRGSRNLDIYRKYISRGNALSARDEFYYGRELYYNGFFTEAIAVLERFLSRSDGWAVNKIEACKVLSACRLAQGDEKNALQSLFSSFSYGAPRAGVLCEIAHIFTCANKLTEAEKWYEFALRAGSHKQDGDFENGADQSLIPLLGLTAVCYRLGEKEKACAYHKQAFALFPTHPSVAYNERFFQKTP